MVVHNAISSHEAVARISQLYAHWVAEFARLRRERVSDVAKLAVEYCDVFFDSVRINGVKHADAAVLVMLRAISDAMVSSWGTRSLNEHGGKEVVGYAIDDGHPEEDEPSELELIPEEDRSILIGRLRMAAKDTETFGAAFREVIAYAHAKERWDWLVFPVAMVENAAGVTIDLSSPLFKLVAREMSRRLIDYRSPRWNEKLLRSLGYLDGLTRVTEEHSDSVTAQPAKIDAVVHPVTVATVAGRRLAEAFELWEEQAQPGKSAKIEGSRCRLRFTNLYGDLPLASISQDVIRDCRNKLTDIPKRINIEQLTLSGKKLADVIAEAKSTETEMQLEQGLSKDDKLYPRLHPTSIKKDIGILSAVFGIANSEGWMTTQPTQNIKIAGYTKSRRGQSVRRQPFSMAQLATLFSTPAYIGCASPLGAGRHKPGRVIVQDPLYWVFLFGATNGCRLEEIGQVYLSDIGTAHDDRGDTFTFIEITDEGEDQTVKTDDSIRCIIVHPQLIRLGFNEYVARRRAAGATTLFDLERKGKRRMMTGALSQKVNRYIDRHITSDKRFVWYSTRHAFADRALKIPREIARQLTGHSHGGLYGSGMPADELASVFADLDVSFIKWDDMVRALQRAKRENMLF